MIRDHNVRDITMRMKKNSKRQEKIVLSRHSEKNLAETIESNIFCFILFSSTTTHLFFPFLFVCSLLFSRLKIIIISEILPINLNTKLHKSQLPIRLIHIYISKHCVHFNSSSFFVFVLRSEFVYNVFNVTYSMNQKL